MAYSANANRVARTAAKVEDAVAQAGVRQGVWNGEAAVELAAVRGTARAFEVCLDGEGTEVRGGALEG